MSADEFYEIVERESVRGYRLTDSEYGFPFIRREDVETDGTDRFVIRFRLPFEFGEGRVRRVLDDVCKATGFVEPEAYMALANEYGIDYWECAWILSRRQEVDG